MGKISLRKATLDPRVGKPQDAPGTAESGAPSGLSVALRPSILDLYCVYLWKSKIKQFALRGPAPSKGIHILIRIAFPQGMNVSQKITCLGNGSFSTTHFFSKELLGKGLPTSEKFGEVESMDDS